MNWLSPNFLFAAAAVVLPITLHLLRRRVTRVVPFPSLRFLAPSRPDDRRRQNLRRRVVLALRCLALAALAAAFARPFFGAPEAVVQRATLIVVDNSHSLQAGQRWPDLVRWAVASAGPFNGNETLGVMLMNPRPTWLVAPTRDTAAAVRALEALPPGWHATRAEPALRLAGDVLAASPVHQRRIVFLGDQQALGWNGADFARPLPPGVELLWPPPVDAPARQAAIEAVSLRRADDQLAAEVTIRNFGEGHLRTIQLFIDGDASDPIRKTVALENETTTTFGIPLPNAPVESTKWIRAVLDADELPADDTAWAVAPAASGAGRTFVILDASPVGGRVAADYVETAFNTFHQLSPALRMIPATEPEWPADAVAFLRSPASFGGEAARKLDVFLAAGGSAVVFMDGDADQLAWLARHDIVPQTVAAHAARLRDWAIEHPLVAPLAESGLRSLVGWTFTRAWSLPSDTVEPIASWADGSPAFGEIRLGKGRLLLAGFPADRRGGDWPIAPGFVPILHRSAQYLADDARTDSASLAHVGKTLELPVGDARWELIDGPEKSRAPETVNAAVAPQAPGLYRWTRGTDVRLYAVNVPTEEGDLAAWPDGQPWEQLASAERAPDHVVHNRAQLAAAEAEQQSPLWWWCFAALGLFLLAELPLANRTAR